VDLPRLVLCGVVILSVILLGTGCFQPSTPPLPSPEVEGSAPSEQLEDQAEDFEIYEEEDVEEEFELLEEDVRGPGATLRGTIKNAKTKKPVPGASVTVTLSTGGRFDALTNGDGHYIFSFPSLPSRITKATFTASREGYRTFTKKLTLKEGKTTTLNVSLKPTYPILKGVVKDKKGRPLEGAIVRLQRGGAVYSTTTDRKGSYLIQDISPGTYTLTVTKSGYRPFSRSVTLGMGKTVVVNIRMEAEPGSTPTALSKWTVMVYMDADNDLYYEQDLEEMERVRYTPQVQVVVQLDTFGYGGTYRYHIRGGNTPYEGDLVETLPEQNMADPATLRDFVIWAMRNYPAERYLLVLWDHGGGWLKRGPSSRGFLVDETIGDIMSTGELISALNGVPRKVDVLAFDACLMQMVEVAYEITSRVPSVKCLDYLVASEEVMWTAWSEEGIRSGLPYHTILADLVANPSMSPLSLVRIMVSRYQGYWSSFSRVTLSAVDLSRFRSSAQSVLDNFATVLRQSPYREQIFGAASSAQAYDPEGNYQYRDLYDFASKVQSVPGCGSAAQQVMQFVQSVVVAEWHSSDLPGSHGISIYLPTGRDDISPKYSSLAFAQGTQWDEFLTAQQFLERVRIAWIYTETSVYSSRALPQGLQIPGTDLVIPEHTHIYTQRVRGNNEVWKGIVVLFYPYPGASRYNLYRRVDNGPFELWMFWNNPPQEAGLLGFGDSGVQENHTYTYYITASVGNAETPPSESVSLRPVFLPPIYLVNPPDGATISSPPTFSWNIAGNVNTPLVYTYLDVYDVTSNSYSWWYGAEGVITQVPYNYDGKASPLEKDHEYAWRVTLFGYDSSGKLVSISWSDEWHFSYQ